MIFRDLFGKVCRRHGYVLPDVLVVLYVVLVLTILSPISASSETIRDERGRVIGHLRDEGSTIRLTNERYTTLGFFLRSRNVTVDAQYKPIGPGNQLGRLLER